MINKFEMVVFAPAALHSLESNADVYAYDEGVEILFTPWSGEEGRVFIPKEDLVPQALLSSSVMDWLQRKESESGRPVNRKRARVVEIIQDMAWPYGEWEWRRTVMGNQVIRRPDLSFINMMGKADRPCPFVDRMERSARHREEMAAFSRSQYEKYQAEMEAQFDNGLPWKYRFEK